MEKEKYSDTDGSNSKNFKEKKDETRKKLNYSAYYNDILVKEQPFYNADKSHNEKYVPVGKQDWIK